MFGFFISYQQGRLLIQQVSKAYNHCQINFILLPDYLISISYFILKETTIFGYQLTEPAIPGMKRIIIFLLLIFLQLFAFSQKEWSNWYSNGKELLTFKNGVAERVTNFITSIPPVPPYENYYHFSYWGNGGISYSDPVTGDMKFIISSRLGYGKNYKDFPNDTFIRSCPDQKSYHIIPFQNDSNKFYVLQFQSAAADLLAQESGLQVRCPNAVGLAYSIVDLSKNGGLGDFVITNMPITGGLTEQITLVRHRNGKDVWIIVHPYGTAQYQAILATDAGFQPPVVSNIGATVTGGFIGSLGNITASHDGKLLAGFRSIAGTGGSGDIELFDFNNASGLLSNYRTLPLQNYISKLQFSPDNSKLYSIGAYKEYGSGAITQWDFNQPDVAASITTVEFIRNSNMYDMQLAPDGKIYVSSFNEYVDDVYRSYLIAIQCPNLPQYACNVNIRAIEIDAPAFPDLVNDFINVPRVPTVPKFSIGNDTSICFGSLTLTAPQGWQSYRWNTGETSRSITVKKAGQYYVLTGSTGFSCPTGYGYINVADKAIKLDLGRDTVLCANTTFPLHLPDSYTNILWANGSTVRDSLIKVDGNIIISANDLNGCYTNDTVNIYYKYYPRAAFGNDTVLCNNEVLKLQLYPVKGFGQIADYTWQNNTKEDTFTVRQPGTYWATVIYDGCTVSDTIKVSYVNGENVGIGNDTTLCAGDSLLLSSSIANAKYLWNTGDTTQNIYVKNSGEYNLRVTNGACTLIDTIKVTFTAKANFSLGTDTAICQNQLLSLAPNTGDGFYLWQDGSVLNNYKVTSAGIYWLKLTQNGCSVADSITVTFKNLPPLNLGKDTGICTNTNLRLNAFNAAIESYTWQDQSTLSYYNASVAGSYAVLVTGINGCQNRDTVLITTVPLPAFNLGNDTLLCNGKSLTLSFNIPGANYLWQDGVTVGQYAITTGGTYWLKVAQQGCSKTDSLIINYKVTPVVKLGNDTTLCEGVTKVLNATNSNAIYKWQDGSSNADFTVKKAGLFFVAVEINGCKAADSIKINYTAKPLFTLGRDTFICKGQAILLKPVLNTAVEYKWQDGSNRSELYVTDTGKYVLTVLNQCGTASNSIEVSRGVCELFVPTAFSPNADTRNDIFKIKYPFPVKKFNMAIYNRYGQKVFETADMQKGWDGNLNGMLQPIGAYIWVISFTDIDGRNKALQGTVMLIK